VFHKRERKSRGRRERGSRWPPFSAREPHGRRERAPATGPVLRERKRERESRERVRECHHRMV
jgi:hypothetical protein